MAKACPVTMVAKFDPGHTHVCNGDKDHESVAHMCSDLKCRRYFWKKGALV